MRPVLASWPLSIAAALACACSGGGGSGGFPVDQGACGDASYALPGADGGTAAGCGPRHTCDRAGAEPFCRCAEGYTGADCSDCERGYGGSDAGVCVPVPLDCSRRPCAHGTCVEQGPVDSCRCPEAYTGRTCADCAAGYQDRDEDGTCEPTCAGAKLICAGYSVCSERSGTARCECVPGYAGASCTDCAAGWKREPGGACVPTCASGGLDCGAHGRCVESERGARCDCQVGWAGDRCDGCAPTHSLDAAAGLCVAAAVPGHPLLLAGTLRGGTRGALFALDPARAHAVALSETPGAGPYPLACSPGSEVYAGGSPVKVVDPARGEWRDLPIPDFPGASRLAHGVSPPRLHLLDSDTFATWALPSGPLSRIPLADGSALFPLHLGVDAAGAGLYATVGQLGSAPGRIVPMGFDGSSGARLPLQAADLVNLEPRGIAAEPGTGAMYVVAQRQADPTANLHDYCREVSRALRFDMSSAPVSGTFRYGGAAGATETLGAEGRTPTLFTYGSYSASRPGGTTTLVVDTRHPDSFVCVTTYYEPIRVVVQPGARFRYLVLTARDPSVSLEVMDGFPAPPEGERPIRVYVERGGFSSTSSAVRVYSRAEWLGLGVQRTGYSTQSFPVLLSWDPASGAVNERRLSSQDAELVEVSGLCPWRNR